MSYIQALFQHLPAEAILTENIAQFGHDATDIGNSPSVVVFPTSDAHVSGIIAIANAFKIPIIARGAGTGKSGGASVTGPAIVMSFANMNQILEIDIQNRIAIVEPGVITQTLQNAVEEKGLFYPPDPASLDRCTLGGNIAENAGGPRALRYGVTGNYVVGLSGFYVDGTPFEFGGKLYKNVAGYDLINLLIGSEGTLAIITKIILRLIPMPAPTLDILAIFTSPCDAIKTLTDVCTSSVLPTAAEFMDKACVEAVTGTSEGEAYVLFEVDTKDRDIVQTYCGRNDAIRILTATTQEEKENLWALRRSISEALKKSHQKISHDIVVPPAEIGTYITKAKEIAKAKNVTILGYGHLGDGNIHVNILLKKPEDDISESLLKLAVELGGSITGEHGIGLTKKPYLSLMFSQKDIAVMKAIKTAFDPHNLLNPGKIF